MNFNTPIDDPTMINDLLDYDWIIKDFGDTGKWTNCPKNIYEKMLFEYTPEKDYNNFWKKYEC